MDFRLYWQVLYRHKVLVIGGLVLALALAEFSMVSVGANGIRYRHSQLWSSTTRMALGQVYVSHDAPDPSFSAAKYAVYATSDPVRRLMLRDGPLHGKIVANPVLDSNGGAQPFVDISGISTSASASLVLVDRATRAFQTFIRQKQAHASQSERVPVHPILRSPPVVFQPRSKTLPILIFLAVTFAFVGLAFVLENVKGRERELDEPEPDRKDNGAEHIEGRPVGVESQAAARRRSA